MAMAVERLADSWVFVVKSVMNKVIHLFYIRKDERIHAYMALAVIVVLNVLLYRRLVPFFMQEGLGPYWNQFLKAFHLSGYDPYAYMFVTDWDYFYDVIRHPLLAYFAYPLFLINSVLSSVFGINCAWILIALIITCCAFYSWVFLVRIMREVIGLEKEDALLLSLFSYSMAYIMMTMIVPDHFSVSMMILLLLLYVSGHFLLEGKCFTWQQGLVIFVLTAGITLSNGIKVLLAGWFVNRGRFFRLSYFMLAVVLPSLVLLGIGMGVKEVYVKPRQQARELAEQQKKEQQLRWEKSLPLQQQEVVRRKRLNREKRIEVQKAKSGTPIAHDGVLSWTDVTTSRTQTVYENLFGESIQFHQQHFLEDVLVFRPVFVSYDWIANYIVEGVIILLFVIGVWCGRHSRFLWLGLSWFGFDMVMHLGLGFGMNEVFIMAPHWLFVLPIATAFVFRCSAGLKLLAFRTLLAILTLFLMLYNGILLTDFLLQPVDVRF